MRAPSLAIGSVLVLALGGCGDDRGSGPSDASTSSMPGAEGTTATGATGSQTPPGDTTVAATGGAGDDLLTSAGSTAHDGPDPSDGPPPGDDCRVAADCVLDDDCCHCAVYPDMLPNGHGCATKSCTQTTCEDHGIPDPTPLCLEGHCVLPKVPCDRATVTCDEAPPDCSDGHAPQIVDGCYTQACIPLSSCEEVAYFSCDECDAGETCVPFGSCAGDACTGATACLPDPGTAVINCATAGDVLCGFFGPGYACFDDGTGPHCCSGDAAACEAL
jgi:hypothetical protein